MATASVARLSSRRAPSTSSERLATVVQSSSGGVDAQDLPGRSGDLLDVSFPYDLPALLDSSAGTGYVLSVDADGVFFHPQARGCGNIPCSMSSAGCDVDMGLPADNAPAGSVYGYGFEQCCTSRTTSIFVVNEYVLANLPRQRECFYRFE